MKYIKNKKLMLGALLGAVVIIFLLVGISNTSKVYGDWELISLQQGDTEISGDDLTSMYNGTITYSFEKDGVLIVRMMDQELEGSYKVSGSEVEVTYNGVSSIFELSGDEMFIEDNGFVFTIQKTDK